MVQEKFYYVVENKNGEIDECVLEEFSDCGTLYLRNHQGMYYDWHPEIQNAEFVESDWIFVFETKEEAFSKVFWGGAIITIVLYGINGLLLQSIFS